MRVESLCIFTVISQAPNIVPGKKDTLKIYVDGINKIFLKIHMLRASLGEIECLLAHMYL